MNKLETKIHNWALKHLSEHVSFTLFGRKVTVFGANAMWFAVEFYTRRWGYVVFRAPTWNPKFKWMLYVSPNATPSIATFAVGPGVSKQQKRKATLRRQVLGHNFYVDDWDYAWLLEMDEIWLVP